VLKDSEVLDPSGGGSRVTGVFGFCSIRNFMDITECLQEELMVFVNRVAAIVHFATNKFAGAANKNIGEAFLVVWRLTDKDKRAVLNDRQTTHIDTEDALDTQLADNALLSFLKIITDLEDSSSSGELHTYEKYGRLMDRFPGGFKVSMGFGLHYGWAIEGTLLASVSVVVAVAAVCLM
jgi:class 3 adenylate cyclase